MYKSIQDKQESGSLLPYRTVYITQSHYDTVTLSHPPGPISRGGYLHSSWNSVGAKNSRRWKVVGESFRKTHRSVLARSWLSSNRSWKNAPGVCVILVIFTVIFTVVYSRPWMRWRVGVESYRPPRARRIVREPLQSTVLRVLAFAHRPPSYKQTPKNAWYAFSSVCTDLST